MASEKISILVTLNDKASPGLKNLSSKFKTFSSKTLAAATKAMKAFGIVAAVALGAGVKKAAEFEQQMSDVSTLITGDSTVAIDELSSGIMDLIKVVPKSANDLGAASYQIFSAGVTDSADALTVLEAAAKLGTAGLGTTGEAADLLTSAINAFGMDASDADKIADIFFKTVKAGKTTIADLAGGFGSVGPVAAQLGIDLDELQAATAALTTVGLPTTEAQTQLTAVMKALIKPTTEMESLFKTLGIESGVAAIKEFGLVGTMQKLNDVTDGNEQVLAKAFGRVEGFKAAMSLANNQAEAFEETLGLMRDGTDLVGEGFEKQAETAKSSMQIMKNNLDSVAISLTDTLLPPLKNVTEKISEFVSSEQFQTLMNDALAFAGVIKDVLGEAFIFVRDSIVTPFMDAVDFDLLKENAETFMSAVEEKMPAIKETFTNLATAAGNIVTAFGEIVSFALESGALGALIDGFELVAGILKDSTQFIADILSDFNELTGNFDIGEKVRKAGEATGEWVANAGYKVGSAVAGAGYAAGEATAQAGIDTGNFFRDRKQVDDFILRPNGQLLETNPNDTIMGTQNGQGGSMVVNIENIYGTDPTEIMAAAQEQLANKIRY